LPNPPPAKEIARLTHLAQETRMAAATFLRGDILMSRTVRDVAIEANHIPFQFVREKDEMTSRGRQYAEETYRLLNLDNATYTCRRDWTLRAVALQIIVITSKDNRIALRIFARAASAVLD
jgi:hypothetical protein